MHSENATIQGSYNAIKQRLMTLTHPAVLVVDEIGYLTVAANKAKLFFQPINSRYRRASTVRTSNKGFEEWGEILHDEVMAATLLDRLLPGATSSTSGAIATGCGTTGSFPRPFIRRLPGQSVPSKPRSRSSHDEATTRDCTIQPCTAAVVMDRVLPVCVNQGVDIRTLHSAVPQAPRCPSDSRLAARPCLERQESAERPRPGASPPTGILVAPVPPVSSGSVPHEIWPPQVTHS